MHHWNMKFLPLQHFYYGSLFLQHKAFSFFLTAQSFFFIDSELFWFASWILWESVQFNPAIECPPFSLKTAEALKTTTAEATEVSRTALPTNTLFQQCFQIMLWNYSFGFCVSPWRHFFNNSTFPYSVWENISFNTFTIYDVMVILSLYVFSPVSWSLWYLHHDSEERGESLCQIAISSFRTIKQYCSYTLFHFIQFFNTLSYGLAIVILQCISVFSC